MDSLAFLEELLSIPSPSGQEDAVAEYLVRQMAARDHTPDEHVEIEEFHRGIDVLAQALEILVG